VEAVEDTPFKGIAFLDSLAKWEKGNFSPLEIPKKIMKSLGQPQDLPKSIHVAGTNGKGTTCAAIASVLNEAGFRVGQCSSPHLESVTERCLINEEPISLEKFDVALCEVAEAVDWDNRSMTYFVACVAAFFVACKDLDWIVVETGLGGLYDATNVISAPEYCVVTSIGFDHCDVLGKTISEIASNKAGIIKNGAQVFAGELFTEAKSEVEAVINSTKAEWGELQNDGEVSCDKELSFSFPSSKITVPKPSFFLRSKYVQSNLLLASKVCLSIGIDEKIISKGFEDLEWPARMELLELSSGDDLLIDGAHNPAAVRALVSDISSCQEKYEKIVFLLGLRKRDACNNTLLAFKELLLETQLKCDVIAVDWEDDLALKSDVIAEYLDCSSRVDFKDIAEFVFRKKVQTKPPPQTTKAKHNKRKLFVGFGSLYFSAKLRKLSRSFC